MSKREFPSIRHKHSLRLKDDLIRIWLLNVNVTAPLKHSGTPQEESFQFGTHVNLDSQINWSEFVWTKVKIPVTIHEAGEKNMYVDGRCTEWHTTTGLYFWFCDLKGSRVVTSPHFETTTAHKTWYWEVILSQVDSNLRRRSQTNTRMRQYSTFYFWILP